MNVFFANRQVLPYKNRSEKKIFCLNPQEAGAYFTHLPVAGGFQRYRKSFRIGHKPFYSQVNDKEW